MLFKYFRTQKRLDDIEATLQKLVDERKKLNLEWDEMYEKFRTLHARISKRVERLNQSPDGEDTQPGEGGVPLEAPAGTSLSPRALEAQRKILARRGKVVNM